MKLAFVNYADEKFSDYQKTCLKNIADHGAVDMVVPYTRPWLESTKFYEDNKHILDLERGGGYCAWKPYVILNTMLQHLEEGDFLLYVDSGDETRPGIGDYVRGILENQEILLVQGAHPNKCWTKRDCFVKMGCDSEEYWNANQLEAGVCAFKKCERIINLLKEWGSWCLDEDIITEKENTCGKDNFECFEEHRYDQSVLTNLSVKYNIPRDSGAIRNYVTCNAYA